jgi:two-component system chemotaxis sensor kinase CheA
MSADPLVQAFFDEGSDLLVDFEAGVLCLEEGSHDAELLNRIFRSAHTLKGNSAMLGFERIARFTHALEDLLDQLRTGRRPVTPRAIDALLASSDVLRSLVAAGQADRPDGSADERAAEARALSAIQAILDADETAPAEAAATPAPAAQRVLWEIEFRPPADLLRRGLDPQRILEDVGRLGEVLQTVALTDGLPPLASLDPEVCYLGWRIFLLGTCTQADVEACFEFVGDPAAVSLHAMPMDPAGAPAATTPAPGPLASPPPPAVPSRPVAMPSPLSAQPAAPAAEVVTENYAGPDRRRAAGPESASIRVPVEKVDRLIDLVGELVITQSMIAQTVAAFSPAKLPALLEAVAQMDRHARELHERMMGVRMIPIKTLFARFPRLIRDLAGPAGKQVILETHGEETELDKTVIERIADPLTHLVRNAIDHGLERPEARQAAGKPATGCVRLGAYQQGGNIFLEITDDGRGLDRDKLVTKAVALGLIDADEALTDEEAFALIFRAGFSTADRITEISGRGVGMDVVRQNVEALGGSIAIQTEPGRGTTFRVKLPLTLAIVDGQILAVGDQSFVVPVMSIVESVQPRREHLHRVLGAGETITIRNRVLPLIRVHRVFGVAPRSEDPTAGLVVVVEQDGRLAALLVDELLSQQQVVIKSLENNFDKVRGVAGATILGDGRVTLILDVPGLLGLARGVEVEREPLALTV